MTYNTAVLDAPCPSPYKDDFPKERQARAAVRAMRKRGKRGRGKYVPQQPYRCGCGMFHLNHAQRRTDGRLRI
ncbi:hypothetical protein EB75_04110 [Mycobacterium sp. ST-F2]|nr:hypothetical protein EB75_04110 [Mycobacterium sp. ST-F2]